MTGAAVHETQADRDKADTTIAVCKCGHTVIAVVTQFIDRSAKKDLMNAVLAGCDIRHVTAEHVRKMPFGCECTCPSDFDLRKQ